MYHRFFGMQRKPFGIAPDATAYCPLTGSEEALAALRYTIVQQSGIGLVTGEEGTGKTIVCLRLATLLDPTFAIALVTQTNFATVKAFYQAVHYDLGLPYYGMDEQELRLSLSDFLLNRLVAGGRTVIIVDDAHNLPTRVLEELRLLSEAEAQGTRLANIVLAAHPRIQAKLNQPELRGLRHRIVAHAHLEPLNDLETATYIRHQIRRCGGDPTKVITNEAIELIHEKTGGVPRLINRLCDHAFIVAFAAERPRVDRETVEAAWTDLVSYFPEDLPGRSTTTGAAPGRVDADSTCQDEADVTEADYAATSSEEICVSSSHVTSAVDTGVSVRQSASTEEWIVDDHVAQLDAKLYEEVNRSGTAADASDKTAEEGQEPIGAQEAAGEEWDSVEIGPEQTDVPSLLDFVGRLDAPRGHQGSDDSTLLVEHGPHAAPTPHRAVRKVSSQQRRLFARLIEQPKSSDDPED